MCLKISPSLPLIWIHDTILDNPRLSFFVKIFNYICKNIFSLQYLVAIIQPNTEVDNFAWLKRKAGRCIVNKKWQSRKIQNSIPYKTLLFIITLFGSLETNQKLTTTREILREETSCQTAVLKNSLSKKEYLKYGWNGPHLIKDMNLHI